MQVGIDLVEIDDFAKQLEASPTLVDKYLSKYEQADRNLESLAGLFAAKEAAIKAGVIGKGEWLKLTIINSSDGKPFFKEFKHIAVSITHTKNTAAAVVIV